MSSRWLNTGTCESGARTDKSEITILSWASSLTLLDGGGQRVRAFQRYLEGAGVKITTVPIGLPEEKMATVTTESALHSYKRQLFPVPFRMPITRELSAVQNGNPVISLMSGSHRWAIDNAPSAWIDFPDLWSEYARVAACSRARLPAAFSRCQGSLWRHRERWEVKHAAVATTASFSDAQLLGMGAHWLPNPVYSRESNATRRNRFTKQVPVFGMLANFDYPPNRSAYSLLVRDWLPVLQSENVRIIVAGFSAETLEPTTGIENWGTLADISEFYDEIDAALAPMTEGGGMKVKVVEALAKGVPVIATNAAVTGLPPAVASSVVRWRDMTGGWLESVKESKAIESEEARSELEKFSFEAFDETLTMLLEKFASL